jgi:hypothetical protein
MKLENQVCSLEYAKRLKELGFPQDSLFYWVRWKLSWQVRDLSPKMNKDIEKLLKPKFKDIEKTSPEEFVSAYTVAELGELLPNPLDLSTKKEIKHLFFGSEHVGGYWECGSEKMLDYTFEAKTEADARAKMLIWLAENGYIKPSSEEKKG